VKNNQSLWNTIISELGDIIFEGHNEVQKYS
jgi:hypothetical protein